VSASVRDTRNTCFSKKINTKKGKEYKKIYKIKKNEERASQCLLQGGQKHMLSDSATYSIRQHTSAYASIRQCLVAE
jgi:hypothetical protein